MCTAKALPPAGSSTQHPTGQMRLQAVVNEARCCELHAARAQQSERTCATVVGAAALGDAVAALLLGGLLGGLCGPSSPSPDITSATSKSWKNGKSPFLA